MARVVLEEMAMSDWRFEALAQELSLDVFSVYGRVMFVWKFCQDQRRAVLTDREIDGSAKLKGFAQGMAHAALAKETPAGFYICGMGQESDRDETGTEVIVGTGAGRLGELEKYYDGRRGKRRNVAPVTPKHSADSLQSTCRQSADPSAEPRQVRSGQVLSGPGSKLLPTGEASRAAPADSRGESEAKRIAAIAADKLNREVGAGRFQATSKSLLTLVRGRMRDSKAGEREFRVVIWYCARLWHGDEKMRHNLKPSTLFCRGKFDDYVALGRAEFDRVRGAGEYDAWQPDARAPPENDETGGVILDLFRGEESNERDDEGTG